MLARMRRMPGPGLVALLMATACGDGAGGAVAIDAAVDAAPAPIDGTWTLTRTVATQGTPPCRVMSGSTETLVVAVGASPEFTLPDHSVFDPQIYPHAVTATTIQFVAEEFGLFSTDPGRPILINHDLHLDGAALVGTARALGDGDDLHCVWSLTVTGARAP